MKRDLLIIGGYLASALVVFYATCRTAGKIDRANGIREDMKGEDFAVVAALAMIWPIVAVVGSLAFACKRLAGRAYRGRTP